MFKNICLLAALAAAIPAWAGSADEVSVEGPYVRMAPPGAPATAAFMALRNSGGKVARLVKVDNGVAKVTELHNHINDGGVMRMRQVKAIEIPAKGEARLEPGGLHVILIDLKAPLKEGASVPLTLGFEDGSSKTVEAKVVRPGAAAQEHHHGHHH